VNDLERALSTHWTSTWSDLGLAEPSRSVLDELLVRYSEAHRAYHTTQHLGECFESFASAREGAEHPGEVGLALWFHDAIYDPRSSDNEARSADWAERVAAAAGASGERLARVRDLILATRHSARPDGGDAGLTVDIDLSILGASAERFDEYEAQVRREYAFVPEAAFGPARARILEGFVARERIYTTAFFRERLEARARLNLRRSIAQLSR